MPSCGDTPLKKIYYDGVPWVTIDLENKEFGASNLSGSQFAQKGHGFQLTDRLL